MSEKHFLAAVTLVMLAALPLQAQNAATPADQTQSTDTTTQAPQITAPEGFAPSDKAQLKSGTAVYSADGTEIGSIV